MIGLPELIGEVANGQFRLQLGGAHEAELVSAALTRIADGGKLKEIAAKHKLKAPKCFLALPKGTDDLVDKVQLPGVKHGDLIDYQHLGLFHVLLEVFLGFQIPYLTRTQSVSDPDSGPGVNRSALKMRGGDARGSGNRNRNPSRFEIIDVLVQHIGLTRAGRAGQKRVST